jgi:hypothetical protein
MKLTSCLVSAAVLALVLSMPGFGQTGPDWSQYIPSDIDDVIAEDGKSETGLAGLKIWPGPRKLRLNVMLVAYPEKCNTEFLRWPLSVIGIRMDNIPPITTCIKVKSKAGRVFEAFIQDQVGEYLPKEVKLGQSIDIYAAYVYLSVSSKTPGLVVNEFDADPDPGVTPEGEQKTSQSR